jgi:hypothetical protein
LNLIEVNACRTRAAILFATDCGKQAMRWAASIASIVVGCAAAVSQSTGSRAAESCYGWATELVREAEHCVSSVRHPQLGFNYGPDNLFTERGAWCEGAQGQGIGEWVRVRFDPALRFRTVYLRNGHVRTPDTFVNNSRVKRLEIETSNGFATSVAIEDRPEQVIRLPQAQRAEWIKFTIKDVYPGKKYTDACLSKLLVDIEEYQR